MKEAVYWIAQAWDEITPGRDGGFFQLSLVVSLHVEQLMAPQALQVVMAL